MRDTQTVAQERAEDVFFGQLVMNWARWFVIAGAALLVLGTAEATSDLVIGIWPVVGLMALNFYLHGRRLAERPANPHLIALASVLDLVVISIVVATGLGTGQAGIESAFFVAYYPVVLAFAFVMQPRATFAFTALVLGAYAGASVLGSGASMTTTELESFAARLITLAAMGGLGTYFWRIQRGRRRAAIASQPAS
jgi:hypothetical protein